MTTTANELRGKLRDLRAQHEAAFSELLPTAQSSGADRRCRWRDEDIAAWLGTSVDSLRHIIVALAVEFAASVDCNAALLTTAGILAVMEAKASPRVSAIDYIAQQIAACEKYLHDLDPTSE